MASTGNNILSLSAGKSRQQKPEEDKLLKPARTQARTLAITSGKGGVGKSNITTNLAIALAQQGAKVCIFDADTSLANVNILMGLNPKYNIEHLLNGVKTLDEIMLAGPANVSIIPASSGLATRSDIDEKQQARLIRALEDLENRFDYLLIDTAAGIGNNVTRFLRAAQSILLVISTEPTSLTDAFALLRILKRSGYKHKPYVLVNMAINYSNGMDVFKRFDGAVRKYLQLSLIYVGYITDDIAVKESVRHQCPVVLYRPEALATRCFINLKNVLINQLAEVRRPNKFSTFWKVLLASKTDDIQAASVARLLSNNTDNPGDNREIFLNYIAAASLDNNDLMSILQELVNILKSNTNEKNLPASPEIQQRLKSIIKQLQDIYQGDIAKNAIELLRDTAIRLASSGDILEQKIENINKELDNILISQHRH